MNCLTKMCIVICVFLFNTTPIELTPVTAQEQSPLPPPENRSNEYDIQNVLIQTRDNAEISAFVIRAKGDTVAGPTILQYTIYVRDEGRDLESAKALADEGYVAVVAYVRGKRFSTSEIFPYETDANDTYDVIDWISKQDWSNGKVGMFGGSYNGFSQWAATKALHPALKTIVPFVAAGPGMGWPMENNVFVNANYEWAFLVANNKFMDVENGSDRQRFRQMQNRWWDAGAAYNKLDEFDGQPNRLFQRWISHPAYDAYWRNMVPYKEEFAQIDIPVLSIDGYYNDSQNSGLYYLREHYKYCQDAEHYLIIGPYGHFGAQQGGEQVINGYRVDENALIDTGKITIQWLNHILKDEPKPEILKDKINYQVMGMDEWRSAPSIDDMSNESLKFYLSNEKTGDFHTLDCNEADETGFVQQQIDFRDRGTWNNNYYPDPIVQDTVDSSNGFNFISGPLEDSIIISGSFSGQISARVNKRDFDFGVTLYEVTPDNEYFHLSYIVGRASFAKDRTARQLLTPDTMEAIPFSNTHLICKKLSKGSRLLVHLNVNKNPFSQLNYGTGKDVSEESIEDADKPLVVQWHNDSYIEIPIARD